MENILFKTMTTQCKPGENFKYMRILAMVYITFLMSATIMAYKVVNIHGMHIPGSTLIYTCTFFIGNIYAELYGLKYAKRLIIESVFLGYSFAILITFVNYLPSPSSWNKANEFNIVLGHILRFTNAGVIGHILSSFLNVYLLTLWKRNLKGRFFWARSLLASSISEGLATLIAGFITFFGMIPALEIFTILLNAFLFKMLYGFIAVWPTTIITYILKGKERYEVTSQKLTILE